MSTANEAPAFELQPDRWAARTGRYALLVMESDGGFLWSIHEDLRRRGFMYRASGRATSRGGAETALREKLAELATKPAPPERIGAFTRTSKEGEPERWSAGAGGCDVEVTERGPASWVWTLRIPGTGGWGEDEDGLAGHKGSRDEAMAVVERVANALAAALAGEGVLPKKRKGRKR